MDQFPHAITFELGIIVSKFTSTATVVKRIFVTINKFWFAFIVVAGDEVHGIVKDVGLGIVPGTTEVNL